MRHYDKLMLAIALYESECRQWPMKKHGFNVLQWLHLTPEIKAVWLRRAEAEYKDTRP